MSRHAAAQAGVTLIEVLLALAVLSLGCLAMAALNVRALTELRAARQQTRAAALAADIAERIRSQGVIADDEWQRRAAAALPSGSASVVRRANGGLASYVIDIRWTATRDGQREHVLEMLQREP